jgi:hypothetical protein
MTSLCANGLAAGEASISIEREVSGHWSAGGNASYGFGLFWKGPSPLESLHRHEFGDDVFLPTPENLHRESIYVKYWPGEVMKGLYMITAITHGNNSGTDLSIGAGYLIHIWKRLNIYTEYSYAISETDNPSNGLSAGICLIFGK